MIEKETIYVLVSSMHNYALEHKTPDSLECYVMMLNTLNIPNIYRGLLPCKLTSVMVKGIAEADAAIKLNNNWINRG